MEMPAAAIGAESSCTLAPLLSVPIQNAYSGIKRMRTYREKVSELLSIAPKIFLPVQKRAVSVWGGVPPDAEVCGGLGAQLG